MLTPNLKELNALITLINDNDFTTIIDWIKRSWVTQAGVCAKDLKDTVRIEQGKYMQLSELIKYFDRDKLEEAKETLRSANTNR